MSDLYTTQESIVIRSSDDQDPTVSGFEEVELAFTHPEIAPLREGDEITDIGGNRRGGRLTRMRFFFELLPLYVRTDTGTRLRTIGDLDKLERMEREKEFTWLYRVRDVWGTEASRFGYADEDGNDYLLNLTTDPDPGILPRLVHIRSVSRSPVSNYEVSAEVAFEDRGQS